jgi:large subunit ribosomal protein L13
MNTENEKTYKEVTFDAAGKRLGRIASEIAHILIGKDSPDFAPNVVARVKVTVENIDSMALSEKKLSEKEYQRYSGYPGGRKVFTLADVIKQHGVAEVLNKAVYGMLPANKLRKLRMKNLIIN